MDEYRVSERFSQYALRVVATIVVVVLAVGTAVYLQNSRQPSTATYSTPDTTPPGEAVAADTVIDNNQNSVGGKTPTQTPPATYSAIKSSPFDIITLTSPAANATIGSGTVISGDASGLTSVQYRIENAAGKVVVTGPLVVVNGIFYGTIQALVPGSNTGTFEIFDKKASNGAEENDIKINVGFQ